jgi:hypothetical protein
VRGGSIVARLRGQGCATSGSRLPRRCEATLSAGSLAAPAAGVSAMSVALYSFQFELA